jgi:hypothetical protein
MFAHQHIFKFKCLRIRMNFPSFMLNRMNFGKFLTEPHEILADLQTFKFKNLLICKDIGCREKYSARMLDDWLAFFQRIKQSRLAFP